MHMYSSSRYHSQTEIAIGHFATPTQYNVLIGRSYTSEILLSGNCRKCPSIFNVHQIRNIDFHIHFTHKVQKRTVRCSIQRLSYVYASICLCDILGYIIVYNTNII